jgi:hypothetical protein
MNSGYLYICIIFNMVNISILFCLAIFWVWVYVNDDLKPYCVAMALTRVTTKLDKWFPVPGLVALSSTNVQFLRQLFY